MLAPLVGAPCKKPGRESRLSLNLAVRGLDSLRSPCGPPLAVQNAGVLSNPVEASRPSRRCTMQKAWTRIQAFSLNLAVRGLDSLRSPCGPPLAVQNAGVLSNPVEASRPSRRCTCKKPGRESRLSFEFGGERGFEPSIHFRVYTLSRRAPSATQTPHRFVAGNALRCRRALM